MEKEIKKSNYSIGITTFSKRFDYLERLVGQIRSFVDNDILIAINGDNKLKFDNKYRKKVLKLCNKYDNVFPIFFTEQRGLCKLWNTLIVHSKDDWNILLNDDIEITLADIFIRLESIPDKPCIYSINGSFSHFYVHKKCLDDLGYFDERFLGFGHEDGDIIFRFNEKYDYWLPNIYSVHGLTDLRIEIRDENIRNNTSKYSSFNEEFAFKWETPKYSPCEQGVPSSFSFLGKRNLEDIKQYPYEKFYFDNKHLL